jgi:hypothetical protein
MSSSMLQGSNLQSSVSAPSTRDQISSILHQALLITAIAPTTKTLSSFDHLGLDPRNLGCKKVVGWPYYDFTLAYVVLRLSDNTQLAFQSLPVMLGEQFLHRPLQHCQRHPCIRLLILHAAASTELSLVGQILEYSLHSEEKGPFEALSYTWAHASTTQGIIVDGKTFNIRQNLFDALQRLRFPDRPRQLWIDAICIN